MTVEHQKEVADSDAYGLFLYYFILIGYVVWIFLGDKIYEVESSALWATLVFILLNFILILPATVIQISLMDNESKPRPVGDNLNFTKLLLRPKFWCLTLSSSAIIGISYCINDFDGYREL